MVCIHLAPLLIIGCNFGIVWGAETTFLFPSGEVWGVQRIFVEMMSLVYLHDHSPACKLLSVSRCCFVPYQAFLIAISLFHSC